MATSIDRRQALIDGLRDLATFLEQHPDLPVNGYASIDYCVPGADDATGIDNVTTIAAAAEVNVTDVGGHPVTNETTHLYATRSFGPVAYQAVYITSREMADYSALMSYRGTIRADDGPRGDTVRC